MSVIESPFVTSGFNDWKHRTNAKEEHEHGTEHWRCMMTYFIRHKESGRTDSLLLEQYRSEQEYWQKVLSRVAFVVHCLVSRGLLFRGENQIIGALKMGTVWVY